jgi:ubiquinone/menaquinone biosynthesis C-methylase UbiE
VALCSGTPAVHPAPDDVTALPYENCHERSGPSPLLPGYKTAADTYIKGRPDYPPQVSQWLTQTLGLDSHKTVIDLGAGTGKFTGRLVATDAQVIAEPVAQMLEKLSAAWPQVLAVSGTATDLPLPDASVDAVVCAQAFHWFATPEALSEIARVLKPAASWPDLEPARHASRWCRNRCHR